MNWLIIPIEELKQLDPFWENRRKSVDGTKALLHDTIYDSLAPPVMILELDGENETETIYPFPVVRDNDTVKLMETKEWNNNSTL